MSRVVSTSVSPSPSPDGGQREARRIESAAERVEREHRERQDRNRARLEQEAAAHLDALLSITGTTVVLNEYPVDKSSLRQMRHGKRPIPEWLVRGVEELARGEAPYRGESPSPVRAPAVAAATDLLHRALEALRGVGARIGSIGRRHAPAFVLPLVLSCDNPQMKASEKFVAFAAVHPGEAAQYLRQRVTKPGPRWFRRGDDLKHGDDLALVLTNGQPFIAGAGEGLILSDEPGTRVEIVGDEPVDITDQGADGAWATSEGVAYCVTWRRP